VTREVLEDFANDNCVYLELRTTPRTIYDKENNNIVLSKKDYIETVLNELKEFEKQNQMIVRLILSIDRTKGLIDAKDTIETLKCLNSEFIVGVDFSGNPTVSSLQNFSQIFDQIKKMNLKITVILIELFKLFKARFLKFYKRFI
jgi:adenosine deaminase